MNRPPDTSRRVSYEEMRRFVHDAGVAAGLPEKRAELLARFLAGNDLRGNFSHGSAQIATYVTLMREGRLNPDPRVTIVRETPVSALLDGDGGLGYFASYDGTLIVVDKAKKTGIAILLTCNHGHFGAAGLYARIAVEEGLCAYVTSGHQLSLSAGAPHYAAAGGSPMAFGVPAGEEPSVVLDFGAMHDLYAGNPQRDDLARMAPGLVLRSIGLGTICQMWGGFLSGLTTDPGQRPWQREGANQGSLVICFRPDLFIDPADLRASVDEYARKVRTLHPIPGIEAAYLPGGIEAVLAEQFQREGIPFADEHKTLLDDLASDLAIDPVTTD